MADKLSVRIDLFPNIMKSLIGAENSVCFNLKTIAIKERNLQGSTHLNRENRGHCSP